MKLNKMLSFDQLITIMGTILIALIVVYLAIFVWTLQRKNDLKLFIIGDFIFMGFMVLIILNQEKATDILSSLVIAELTLALVWVELSKRPELKLGSFAPIIHKEITSAELAYKAGYDDELPKPSIALGIKATSYKDLKFNKNFSFSVDLSNIGYQEIMVHEYVLSIDGKRQKPILLEREAPNQRQLTLKTQGRHTINLQPLSIATAGFHRINLEVIATTIGCSKEVWFFISEDYRKLRYVEMIPIKKILSPIIKSILKDP